MSLSFADDTVDLVAYAKLVGRHIQTVRRDAREGRLPTWDDPITGKTVTSPSTVARMRDAARAAAEAAFIQKNALGGR